MSNSIIYFKKYLSYFSVVLGLPWCTWAFSSCREQGLLSSCGVQGFSLWRLLLWSTGVRLMGFSSCSIWALVVTHGLRCFTACGIFPDQDSNTFPALASGFFAIVSPRKSQWHYFSCFSIWATSTVKKKGNPIKIRIGRFFKRLNVAISKSTWCKTQ